MKTGTWAKLMVASFGAAGIIAAAQLGVGQALSIIDVSAGLAPGADSARYRLVTWLVFIFGAAILGGVAVGRRVIRRRIPLPSPRPAPTIAPTRRSRAIETLRAAKAPVALAAVRVSASLAAALGAALAFPLVWVPARDTVAAGGTPALLTIAGAAGAGIAVGVVLGIAALAAAPIGVALVVTVAWSWLVALTSVVLAITKDQPVGPPRLGTLDAPWLITPEQWWLGPYLMVGLGALIGLAVAGAARWIGASRIGIALSGFAGPAIIAAAYLVAGPGVGSADAGQIQPYLASVIAATVGLLASTAIGAGAPQPIKPTPMVAGLPAPRPAALPQLGAAPAYQPLAIASTPADLAGVYEPPPRAKTQSRPAAGSSSKSTAKSRTMEGRVLRAEPARRVEAGTYIDAEAVDISAAESRARASARLAAEEREQKAQMELERKNRAEAAAAKKRAEAERRTAAKEQAEAARRAAAEAKARAEAEAKARTAAERAAAEAERKRMEQERQQAEAERKRSAEAAKAKAEEERQQAEAERKRSAEAAKAKAEEERQQAETERKRAAAAAKAKAEEERQRAEAERQREADEARARAEAERMRAESERRRAEEAARAKAEAEAAAKRSKSKLRAPKREPVAVPAQASRDTKPSKANRLRKGEEEHIDWVTNLVNLPHDPDLKTRRG